MKRLYITLLLIFVIVITGCGSHQKNNKHNFHTYYSLDDGSWMCEEICYKERLEIKGTIKDHEVTYILLSNIGDISFEQAELNSGISSNSNDYFDPKDAIMVEIIID